MEWFWPELQAQHLDEVNTSQHTSSPSETKLPGLSFHFYTSSLPPMPYKALSKCVKAIKQANLKEDKLKCAVDVYRVELPKDERACKGVCTIADEFGIPKQYRTIANRAQGHQSATEFAE